MSAVEEIQAAIDKLTKLKAKCTPGPWALTYERASHPRIWGNLDDENADPVAVTMRAFPDAELIVTLHRTINAQLAILAVALKYERSQWGTGSAEVFHAEALALARAVNGGTE